MEMINTKPDLKSLTLAELTDALSELGEKPFRAKQIYQWMHVHLVGSLDEMTNVSKALKDKLKEHFSFTSLKMVTFQESKIDGTRKYLFELADGNVVESVWMKYSSFT